MPTKDADTARDPSVTRVEATPNLTALLARAVLTSPGRGGDTLPDITLVHPEATIDRDSVADYAQVCGFTVSDVLPPTYLHMLAFPLSVQIMADRSFPFALAGLVHVRNSITQHRPVTADEVVDVAVHLADLRPHPKGRQFDVVAEARVDGDVVWDSRSVYLKKGRGGDADDAPTGAAAVDVAVLPSTSVWKVPADIGRQYGAVSGDRNPIHLSPLTARAFGFPKAIAHGMWTKARALAGLEGRRPEAFEVDVLFKLPVLLPATVHYATAATADGGFEFALRSHGGKPHLAGLITPA